MASNPNAEHAAREFDAMIDTLHAIRRIRNHYGSGTDSVRLVTELVKMLRAVGKSHPFTEVHSPAWHVAAGLAKAYNIDLSETDQST